LAQVQRAIAPSNSPESPSVLPRTRRVVQAVLYEGIALAVVAPTVAFIFNHPPASSLALAVAMSAIALAWNYLFNAVFERWEASRAAKGRSLALRIVHGVMFESGLTVILVPLMAYWLAVSLLAAFLADVGLLAFFFVYTVAFTWSFDTMFGLPASALAVRDT
jgi:uncharacterized membrane protein